MRLRDRRIATLKAENAELRNEISERKVELAQERYRSGCLADDVEELEDTVRHLRRQVGRLTKLQPAAAALERLLDQADEEESF